MTLVRFSAAISILVILLLPWEVAAQQNRLLSTGDWTYDYIVRLQRRGHLLELNPTLLPYRHEDVTDALARIDSTVLNVSEQHWVSLLKDALMPVHSEPEHIVAGYSPEFGARMINSERLDVLRPLGDSLHFYGYGTPLSAYVDAGRVVAEFNIRQDQYYNDDPDGLDTALRLLGRSEHTYAGYHTDSFSLFAGRWSHHWGVSGEAATLISSNPRSQDQVALRIGGQRFAITGLLSELDSVTDDGRFTGRVEDDTVRVGHRRRYLAAHRWDIRPSRRFMITFMESAIYSGTSAGPSLKYLNPVHPFVFVVDNTPKNDENNALLAGLLWAQVRRLTVHGQLMVDDLNVQGKGNETLSFAFTGSAVYALSAMDVWASLTAVAARTYNAPQPEGKYIYLHRGLATQFSDFVHGSVALDVYLDRVVPGLRVTSRMDWLWQGEQDIRQTFPANEAVLDNILEGTVRRTVRPSLHVVYQPRHWWWIRLDAGYNVIQNQDHVSGYNDMRFTGLLEAGVRFRIDRAIRVSL